MMNKPVIAIVPLYDQERDSLWDASRVYGWGY